MLAGINGLVEFQAEAAKEDWRVVSVVKFYASEVPSETDATEQLMIIKETSMKNHEIVIVMVL